MRILLVLLLLIIIAVVGVRLARPDLLPLGLPPSVAAVNATHPVSVMIAGQTTEEPAGPPTVTPEPGTPTDTAVPISLGNAADQLSAEGVLLLAMRDGNVSHLFAYHPLYLPLTRLTNNAWDDITPALSPDGKKLAFSSRQNGYWDLYMLDLETGEQTRLTDTPQYEASPSWSPDGLWVAFERYHADSLDIYILPIAEPNAEAIQLTDDRAIDRSPAWSPQGREIAFTSTRSGDEEIWLARLDDIENRFINISRSPLSRDRHPVWKSGGKQLAWASERGSEHSSGEHRLAVWEDGQFDQPGRLVGDGSLAAWSPDGQILFSAVRGPNQTDLAAYRIADGRLIVPFSPLPGDVSGMVWVRGPLPAWLQEQVQKSSPASFPALWEPLLTKSDKPKGRMAVVAIQDVAAPQALLHDAVDEGFNLLRQRISQESGWDALSSLENAYVTLTSPATPSIQDDWLFTGRAFAANPLLLSGGWMAISREDFGGQTYWRVYLKARFQDGSMGAPLPEMAWDLNARYNGDPKAYEQGGKLSQPPAGYWIDLTELASRYGWERLPAWVNWRTFYPAIRFNQFVIRDGLDWFQAMSELYPPEALVTATPVPTFTQAVMFKTAEPTPEAKTRTPTPTVTLNPNRRPTWTPPPPTKQP